MVISTSCRVDDEVVPYPCRDCSTAAISVHARHKIVFIVSTEQRGDSGIQENQNYDNDPSQKKKNYDNDDNEALDTELKL
ncbi:hypothetical protein EJB05_09254 [Eragrostis curvula]|uniref:Uncharacterized protein n=1 Tax=Eragrostis curvula TaxID=38414 RepID=A0A5J9W4G1_9POAL|nr:hypothetical protein EJB05_09254 [Eragrostis curvula]